jgi:uncharacterized protein (TIGR03437 family)
VDSSGNLYIVDEFGSRVRKVSNGVITTVAGNGTQGFSGDNGPAASAQLNFPVGVAVDSVGNIYIAYGHNNRIRKVSNGVITTVAGNGAYGFGGDNGLATSAELSQPNAVTLDSSGNLYIADTEYNHIRMVSGGVITTVAGDGVPGFGGDNGLATNAALNNPGGVAVDSSGNLYIADSDNFRIRKVSKGVIATVAGNGTYGFSGDNGPATGAKLAIASAEGVDGVAVDTVGNLFIVDTSNQRIRKVFNGVITTVAGSGTEGFGGDAGPATSAELHNPGGIAMGSGGNLYIADPGNGRVRLLTPEAVPTINQNGIVPIYSAVPVIQPGSWISIHGSGLANGSFVWSGDFPTSLGEVNVAIDNKPAYLWLVSPTQINLQAPDDMSTGTVSVVVTTAFGTAASTVTLSSYGPSFSVLGDGKHAAGEVATPDGTGAYGGGTYDLVGPSGAFSFTTRPVKPGETLILYGVGFGPTTPQVPAGRVFSGVASTNSAVVITLGAAVADVAFSGITEAGLYQFNLTVPPNTSSGDQSLQATVNGVQTPLGPVVTVQ